MVITLFARTGIVVDSPSGKPDLLGCAPSRNLLRLAFDREFKDTLQVHRHGLHKANCGFGLLAPHRKPVAAMDLAAL